jgi:hypothetical protein
VKSCDQVAARRGRKAGLISHSSDEMQVHISYWHQPMMMRTYDVYEFEGMRR